MPFAADAQPVRLSGARPAAVYRLPSTLHTPSWGKHASVALAGLTCAGRSAYKKRRAV